MSALWLAWLPGSKNSSSGKSPIAGQVNTFQPTAVLLIQKKKPKANLSASLSVFPVCCGGSRTLFTIPALFKKKNELTLADGNVAENANAFDGFY